MVRLVRVVRVVRVVICAKVLTTNWSLVLVWCSVLWSGMVRSGVVEPA